jgi:hypothetical protein
MWKGVDVASVRGLIIVSLGLKIVNNNAVVLFDQSAPVLNQGVPGSETVSPDVTQPPVDIGTVQCLAVPFRFVY